MTAIYLLNTSLTFCTIGIGILLLALTLFAGNLKQRVNFFFFLNVLANLLGMLCEVFVGIIEGSTGPVLDVIIRVFDCVSFCTSGLQFITFALYLREYLSTKTVVSKRPFNAMLILSVVSILLSIIASVFGWFSGFDANNYYIRQDTFWISEICPILAMSIWFGTTLYYKKVLKIREWLSLMLYAIVPMICFFIEIFVEGLYIYAVGGAFTVFLIYMNIQVETKQQARLKEVELKQQMKIKEAELTENKISIMLSQIQPHFLYNTLNTIEALTATDPQKARVLVGDFSTYLRQNMDSLKQLNPVPFDNELEHIRLYLSIEKQRFMDRLNVKYDLEVTSFTVPVLTVQPLVENAVRHGVTKKREGGTVTISTRKLTDKIQIIVEDDGIGFDTALTKQDGRSHVGIDNVKQRLAAQFGGTLTVESKPGIGTVCVITIPQEDIKL